MSNFNSVQIKRARGTYFYVPLTLQTQILKIEHTILNCYSR